MAGLTPAALFLRITAAAGSAWSALWTFPSILLSAFLVAWGAEAAQFVISQGLSLALLAWLQTLPEFAVEAVIAWEAGKDPTRSHLAIANLTGAIRLLIGLGWPMIYFVAAYYGRKRGNGFAPITLDREHSVEVMGLLPPLLYFVVIWAKQSLSAVDAALLIVLYFAYLYVLWHCPPHDAEELDEVPKVSRWAYELGGRKRIAAITGLFVAGGFLLYVTAHPFLESMLAVSALLGASPFVMVQWIAPFLSEFPEKLSAFQWARRVSKADMALMNMVSSNINQWTILAAMIPLVYGWSLVNSGHPFAAFRFDGEQEVEIALTIAQSALAMLLLMKLSFTWRDATGLFVLWVVQFGVPWLREEMTVAYLVWSAGVLLAYVTRQQDCAAPRVFLEVWRENRARRAKR